ncbi:MAG: hypothetical protein P1V97_18780 [Planctomycetota bacterium]|nr:hypothetical protein [Planctomycetota bacterium]
MKKSRYAYPLLIVLSCILSVSTASACIWDTHTITDEMATQDTDVFALVSGQFPEHGKTFYAAQRDRALKVLEKDANDQVARNDLGAAYTKLGLHDKALVEFQRLDKEKPNTYETLSNLGVLHKEMGKL